MATAAEVASARDAGDLGSAVAGALEAWRETRAPEIAAALAALTEKALAQRAFPWPRTKTAFQEAWLKVDAEEPDPVATGWLAATLARLLPFDKAPLFYRPGAARQRHAAFLDRLAKLRARTPDPRIAAALASVVLAAPLEVPTVLAATEVYGPVLEALAAQRDPATWARLDDGWARCRGVSVRKFLEEAVPAMLAGLQAPEPAPGGQERAAWAALAEARPRVDAKGAEALLRRIEDSPDDDEARLVWADWLLEAGDPRGEFVVLQVRAARGEATPAQRRRERALFRDHRAQWLGVLDQALEKARFERGCLHSAQLAPNAAAPDEVWAEALADRRLRTLRALSAGRGSAQRLVELATSSQVRWLESLEVPGGRALDALLAGAPLATVTRLDLACVPERRQLERLAQGAGFPALRALEVWENADADRLVGDLAASGLFSRLRELRVVHGTFDEPTGAVLARLWTLVPPTLVRLVVGRSTYSSVEALRDEEGKGATVLCDRWLATSSSPWVGRLPPDVRSLRLLRGPSPAMAEERAQVAAALQAQRPGLEIVWDPKYLGA